jgi:hypothetical protein
MLTKTLLVVSFLIANRDVLTNIHTNGNIIFTGFPPKMLMFYDLRIEKFLTQFFPKNIDHLVN